MLGALVIIGGTPLLGSRLPLLPRSASPSQRRSSRRVSASLCGGVLLCGVVAVASGEVGEATVSQDAVLGVAYLIVVGSFAGFTAYVWLLRVAPISLVATYAYVNPVVAVTLGWALLGEEITLRMLGAGAAIIVSVALIVRASGVPLEPGVGGFRRRSAGVRLSA